MSNLPMCSMINNTTLPTDMNKTGKRYKCFKGWDSWHLSWQFLSTPSQFSRSQDLLPWCCQNPCLQQLCHPTNIISYAVLWNGQG